MATTTVSNKGLPSELLQGIGSILGSEFDQRPKSAAASLRRTLSADMSSKKWLTQHGFSPLKRIASSEELQIEVSDHEEKKNKKDLEEQPGQFDIWCSILSQKPSSLPPPYVHPLVKRSKSSLSGKSLEICTENLGSESGSDGFSSYPPSEISTDEEQDHQEFEDVEEKESDIKAGVEKEEMGVVNYSCSVTRKSPPRSFPPPLPSLSRPGGGLHMRPHRKDGRLVLEAVPVPSSKSYFRAQRQDGRLLLTFINSPSQETNIKSDEEEEEIEDEETEVAINEIEEEFDDETDDEEEEEEMMEDRGIVLEMSKVPKLPTGVINVHRSALMVNKFMGLTNNNRNNLTSWSDHQKKLEKFVKQVVDQEDQESSTKLLPQSLPSAPPPRGPPRMSRLIPSPPPPAVAASFNTYEYCWRRKSSSVVSVSGIHHSVLNQHSLPNTTKNNYCNNYSNNSKNNSTTNNNNSNINNFLVIRNSSSNKDYKEKQQVMGLSGEKGDHLVPYLRSCKEPRRSLLIWEPYCIATS